VRDKAEHVKLLVQPEDGIKPLIEGIDKAKKNIRILIFRFDRSEIEKALVDAVGRGVAVHALIAYTNRGEEKNLRKLEMRLLEKGITVARTADDLVRYHGKMMIVDDKALYVLAYNFTHLDIDLSRSFGIITQEPKVVEEAVRLFEADARRQPYTDSKCEDLIVSPVNARERLTKFIQGAKKRLLLYEMKISDRDIIKLLDRKMADGVEVRVLSRASAKGGSIPVRRLSGRLHLRAILRDGESAFVGSQSLRKLELEARREVGVIVHEKAAVKRMEEVFDADWKKSEPVVEHDALSNALTLPAKKVAKAVAKHVSVKPVIEQMLDKVLEVHDNANFEPDEIADTVREAFREEVQGAVAHALRELVVQGAEHSKDAEKDAHGK